MTDQEVLEDIHGTVIGWSRRAVRWRWAHYILGATSIVSAALTNGLRDTPVLFQVSSISTIVSTSLIGFLQPSRRSAELFSRCVPVLIAVRRFEYGNGSMQDVSDAFENALRVSLDQQPSEIGQAKAPSAS